MFKIFKIYKRFKHLFLSKVFERKTLKTLKTITVAVDAINAFEKVKNNSHSLVDKKILDFLDEYRFELSKNENKINSWGWGVGRGGSAGDPRKPHFRQRIPAAAPYYQRLL